MCPWSMPNIILFPSCDERSREKEKKYKQRLNIHTHGMINIIESACRVFFTALHCNIWENVTYTISCNTLFNKCVCSFIYMYSICVRHYSHSMHYHTTIPILQAIRLPLALKYKCPSQTTWKLAVNSLITVLKIGLPVISANGKRIFICYY